MAYYGRGSRRVNLRIPADTYEVIRRVADYEGVRINEVVQRAVEGMRPALDQLAATLDEAQTVQTPGHGVAVLDQLRVMAVHARSEADRLDNLITVWQEGIRYESDEQISA
jgi:uncharacterized protein (DUF1778 family)